MTKLVNHLLTQALASEDIPVVMEQGQHLKTTLKVKRKEVANAPL